jgi:hypothetical protein
MKVSEPTRSRSTKEQTLSAVELSRTMLDFVHRAFRDAREGTAEQLHFVPQQGSHSIAWCLWHTARVEDVMVNRRIQQQRPIWDATWAQRTGLPSEGTGNGQPDAEAQKVRIGDMEAFTEYQEVVWHTTDNFLSRCSDDDLSREVPAGSGTERIRDTLSLHLLGHFNGHRGEVNLLRGMQGMPPTLLSEGVH